MEVVVSFVGVLFVVFVGVVFVGVLFVGVLFVGVLFVGVLFVVAGAIGRKADVCCGERRGKLVRDELRGRGATIEGCEGVLSIIVSVG
jgi:hypothetical protein